MAEYLLGHDAEEWARLEAQHKVWGPALLADLDEMGFAPGCRVLDVGCGSGALLADLAAKIGSDGVAAGLERNPDAARAVRARLGVEVIEGDLYEASLGGPWDWIISRWVFSFLPDRLAAVRRLSESLAPGGTLVIQDYNHDGVGTFPRRPEVKRIIEAFRSAYAARGGDVWVAGSLPADFAEIGLTPVLYRPHVLAGPPGSPPWNWVEVFLFQHGHTLLQEERITQAEWQAFETAWEELKKTPGAVLFTPMVVTAAARK